MLISPLYFVPAARPQQMPAKIKYRMCRVDAHFSNNSSDAVENATRPRSTYTVVESLTMTGSVKKNVAPKSPHAFDSLGEI